MHPWTEPGSPRAAPSPHRAPLLAQARLARTRSSVRDAWGEMRTSPLTARPLDEALDETTAVAQMKLLRSRLRAEAEEAAAVAAGL